MKTSYLIICIFSVLLSLATAEQPASKPKLTPISASHRAALVEFFNATGYKEVHEMSSKMFDSEAMKEAYKDLPPEALKMLQESMKSQVSWTTELERIVTHYGQYISEKEIRKILPIVKNPDYKAFNIKMAKAAMEYAGQEMRAQIP